MLTLWPAVTLLSPLCPHRQSVAKSSRFYLKHITKHFLSLHQPLAWRPFLPHTWLWSSLKSMLSPIHPPTQSCQQIPLIMPMLLSTTVSGSRRAQNKIQTPNWGIVVPYLPFQTSLLLFSYKVLYLDPICLVLPLEPSPPSLPWPLGVAPPFFVAPNWNCLSRPKSNTRVWRLFWTPKCLFLLWTPTTLVIHAWSRLFLAYETPSWGQRISQTLHIIVILPLIFIDKKLYECSNAFK